MSQTTTATPYLDAWTKELSKLLASPIPAAHRAEVIHDTVIAKFWDIERDDALEDVRQELLVEGGSKLPEGDISRSFVWLTPPSEEYSVEYKECGAAACQAVWDRLARD